MRYHAHMQFRVDGELAGAYLGQIGTIASIDFDSWIIELRMPDGRLMATGRQAVTLVNHDTCDASFCCTANADRTGSEP